MRQCTLHETQKLFRILMNAMAAPGMFFDFGHDPEVPLVMKICETLIDNEVTFSVIGESVKEEFINEIALRTGSTYVDAPHASFVIVCGGSSDQALKNLTIGTLEYPERSATVIYMVTDLASADGIQIRLSGPGIQCPFTRTINGMRREEIVLLSSLNSNYPLGLDTIFCDDCRVLALPRTTSLSMQ